MVSTLRWLVRVNMEATTRVISTMLDSGLMLL